MAYKPHEFQQSLVYETTARADEILRDLEQIERLDKQAETEIAAIDKQKTKSCLVTLVGLVLTFAGFALWPLLPFGVLLLIWGIRRSSKLSDERALRAKFDFEDRRYQLLRPLLPLLATDMGDAPFHLVLDLNPLEREQNFKGDSKSGAYSVKTYVQPWLDLQGRLLDGSRFRAVVTQATQVRHKTYRSRSGKYKSKTKRKSRTSVTVQVRVKEARYGHLAALGADAQQAVQLPRHATLRALRAEPAGLRLESFTTEPWSASQNAPNLSPVPVPGWIGMSLLSCYQVLNLSRRLTRAGWDPSAPGSAPPSDGAGSGQLVGRAGAVIARPVEGDSIEGTDDELMPLDALELFQNLVLAALADGVLDPAEKAFLTEQAGRWGLGFDDIQNAVQAVVTGQVTEFYLPRGDDERAAAFRAVAAVCRVDGVVAPRERERLARLADELEIPSALRAQVLDG